MSAVYGRYLGVSNLYTPEEAPQELSRTEIFNQLAQKTCRIEWKLQNIDLNTTGCFIKRIGEKRVQVLTCFHDESWQTARISITYKVRAKDKDLVTCTANCMLDTSVVLENAKRIDLCLLNLIKVDLQVPHFCEKEDNSFPSYLNLGETVYFSGFPLSNSNPLIHMGYVSSREKKGDVSKFSIDGTVVEGHSGGPVVIVNNGNLELIGIINSQMVSMTKTLLIAPKLPIDSVNKDIDSIKDDSESFKDSDVRAVLKELIDNFLRNVSTGIGNANAITNLPLLFQAEPINIQESNSNQMVNKLPTAITKEGSYKIIDERTGKEKTVEFSIRARELTDGGNGPRGISAFIMGVPKSKYSYRIGNPHGGNYNNYQPEVYNAAANELKQQYALNKGKMPANGSFTVKGKTYEFTIED